MKKLQIFAIFALVIFTFACSAKTQSTATKTPDAIQTPANSQELCNQALNNYLGSRELTLVRTRQSESTYGTLDEKYYDDSNFDFEIEVQIIEHFSKLPGDNYYMVAAAVEKEDRNGKTFVCSSLGWKEVIDFKIFFASDEEGNTSFVLTFTEDGENTERWLESP